jgi:hypothetical protein
VIAWNQTVHRHGSVEVAAGGIIIRCAKGVADCRDERGEVMGVGVLLSARFSGQLTWFVVLSLERKRLRSNSRIWGQVVRVVGSRNSAKAVMRVCVSAWSDEYVPF